MLSQALLSQAQLSQDVAGSLTRLPFCRDPPQLLHQLHEAYVLKMQAQGGGDAAGDDQADLAQPVAPNKKRARMEAAQAKRNKVAQVKHKKAAVGKRKDRQADADGDEQADLTQPAAPGSKRARKEAAVDKRKRVAQVKGKKAAAGRRTASDPVLPGEVCQGLVSSHQRCLQ